MGRTSDQRDAFSVAAWLSRAARDSSLAAFFKPDLTPPECAVAQVEGWILGVRNSRPLSLACCDGVATGAVSLS